MARVLVVDDNQELASLLASNLEARGLTPVVCLTGRAALDALSQSPVDGALLDLMLPDMKGIDLLHRLSSVNIPTVVMSGVFKGERFSREATSAGASAFFEKPFAADALLDALAGAMVQAGKLAEGPQLIELGDDDLEELEVEDLEEVAAEELPPMDSDLALQAAASSADETLIVEPPPPPPPVAPAKPPPLPPRKVQPPPLKAVPAPKPAPAPAPAARKAEPKVPAPKPRPPPRTDAADLPFGGRDVWQPRGPKTTAGSLRWTNAGNLAKTSVPRLLTAIYQGQETGELRVRRGEVLKVVFLEKGRPVFASSNVSTEKLARYVVRKGGVSVEKVAKAIEKSQAEKMGLGDALVALGLLTAARRAELTKAKTQEIVWSLFDWQEGEYTFAIKKPGRTDIEHFDLFPGNLILEGIKRTLPLPRLRELVPSDFRMTPTADPPYELSEIELTGPEAMLVAYADGTKTVDDLLVLAEVEEPNARAVLYGLWLLGILEPRRTAPAQSRVVFT